MTAFDHRDTGTPEARWLPLLEQVPVMPAPGPGDVLLVVAAHPDDETLGAGGVIASAARAGATVAVAVASGGEASHPDSPTHDPARLARIRQDEVRRAVGILAPDAGVHFLGLPDGRLQEVAADLVDRLTPLAEAATHVLSPWSGDRHPDHAAAAAASAAVTARHAARHWQYPIWAWHWADPSGGELPWTRLRRVVLGHRERAAKAAAVDCHRSQHAALSGNPGDEAILPPGVLAHFDRGAEVFVVDA